MVSRKPPPPPTGPRLVSTPPRRAPPSTPPPSRARPAFGRSLSGGPQPRPISESFSGLTLPDAIGPDFQDEITVPRHNPYALPPRGRESEPSQPATIAYARTADGRPDEVRTTPGVPRAGGHTGAPHQTLVDTEPPKGVQGERQAAQLYDELYDAVSTEVTRTELLWGLTQFAKRRVQSFRKNRKERKQAAIRELDGQSAQRARPLGATLAQYVRVLGVPMRLWFALVALPTLLVGAAVAVVAAQGAPLTRLGELVHPPSGARPAAGGGHPRWIEPSAPASATPLAADDPPPAVSLADRAAAGDQKAIEELQSRPAGARTADETVALERAKVAQHVESLEEMRARFAAMPELLSDPEWTGTLRAFIAFERTAPDALLVAAGLPGEAGPDLLYDVWTRTGNRRSTTKLAEQLVYGRDVRPRASKALSVALDLYELANRKDSAACPQILEVLRRAIADGDARCLLPLAELRTRTGCGRQEAQDCHPCLRSSPLLVEATRAVRSRPRPER